MTTRMTTRVSERIHKLATLGFGPKAIEADVAKRYPKEERVSLRTVQRVLSARRARDTSDAWHLGVIEPSNEQDPAVILEALREVYDHTEGRVTSLTRNEARWVTLVSRARPDVRGWEAYRWAHRYIEWQATGESTEALDLQLARANPILAGEGVTALDRRARAALKGAKERVKRADADTRAEAPYMTEVVEELTALRARLPTNTEGTDR